MSVTHRTALRSPLIAWTCSLVLEREQAGEVLESTAALSKNRRNSTLRFIQRKRS